MRQIAFICLASAMLISLSACGFIKSVHDQSSTSPYEPEALQIQFVSVQEDEEQVNALADLLAKELGIPVELTIVPNYNTAGKDIRSKKSDVVMMQPYDYVEANKLREATVILQPQLSIGNPKKNVTSLKGQVLFEKSSGFSSLQDLVGKTIATQEGKDVVQLGDLAKAGIDIQKDITLLGVDSDAQGIKAVKNGKADALFAVETVPAQGLVQLETENRIPTDAIAVRPDMTDEWQESIRQAFLSLGESKQGRQLMRTLFGHVGYVPADESDYDIIRQAQELVEP
ncbi:phosphate/phosphite/phosphonate ABC transporter substrate-binding protein [Sporosarcina sp. Te-1]|uniref:phosphate/phosphite/phosphonate ABC transporter substrate-binding protein n=1 Tax=Sporosarcina sp. Te-1 TaxID=2818390 RepID=UPI001A9DE5AE|nr:phosphate/phosphite/phosphonate ABC transporter substrate-binding protein [Sporosarcina sp. Te-1]QTD39944.1 phosphate/phosphite/phosphonate ABC transporter substrate-binding protein [Sporosarcina sp. Te-1]